MSQPYELAQIERIEYQLKRRQDTQKIAQQIIDQMDNRKRWGF